MVAPMVLNGPIDGDWVEAYVRQVLVEAVPVQLAHVADVQPAAATHFDGGEVFGDSYFRKLRQQGFHARGVSAPLEHGLALLDKGLERLAMIARGMDQGLHCRRDIEHALKRRILSDRHQPLG